LSWKERRAALAAPAASFAGHQAVCTERGAKLRVKGGTAGACTCTYVSGGSNSLSFKHTPAGAVDPACPVPRTCSDATYRILLLRSPIITPDPLPTYPSTPLVSNCTVWCVTWHIHTAHVTWVQAAGETVRTARSACGNTGTRAGPNGEMVRAAQASPDLPIMGLFVGSAPGLVTLLA
jgi:hypothetical protein